MGARIEGVAGSERGSDVGTQLVVALALYEGAWRAADAQAGEDDVGRADEMDGGAAGVHVVHVVEIAGSASAGSYDDVLEVGDLTEDGALELAKALFAACGKECGNGLAVTALQIVVGIDEGEAEVVSQGATQSGLSAGHEANKEEASQVAQGLL